ncbi:uncharacterized protein LOC131075868 isoform X1 [Cryptomeria japonica]|uniref:uncharacterized protein LOC131075868 isoform X1 n=1 Tax=Cryptomeria japonica TaxID=3369 RepID=UPI0025ACE4E7|nr:uncharacterized protein LOC131075868 isoform X1 [Cryptomeria japonica]
MVRISGSFLLSLYSMPGLIVSRSTKFGSFTAKQLEVEVNFQGRRPKRVTDPLNEVVRARLCGTGNHQETQNSKDDCVSTSSGSEHEGESVISLTDMVCGFMEDEQEACLDVDEESVSESDSEDPNSALLLEVLLRLTENLSPLLFFSSGGLVSCRNAVDLCLLRYVTQAVEMAKRDVRFGYGNENENKSHLLRSLMNQLKMMGYNAGVCKSRPQHSKDFHAGYYEYIDVIMERRKVKKEERIFVDIDFRAQFEVARPTMEYSGLLQLLPEIFVGKTERLHQIISIMCKAAKRSLKKNTMHIPPWRKYHYMRSKWLGSYRRITTTTTTLVSTTTPVFSTTIDMPDEWQLPTDNATLKPAKNGKVSGLARAFTQPALAQ